MTKKDGLLSFSLLFLYFIPSLLFLLYIFHVTKEEVLWKAFSMSLLFSSLGTLALYWYGWRQTMSTTLQKPDSSSIQKLSLLEERVATLLAEKELISQKALREEKLQEECMQLNTQLGKKEVYIHELKSEIQDLKYEIKALLESGHDSLLPKALSPSFEQPLEQESISSTISPHCQSDLQLQKCLSITQKMTGTSLLGHSLFKDFPSQNFALDLRRLSDALQIETKVAIFLYSLKENRILFANQAIERLLGWKAEKFIQDFDRLLDGCESSWKKALFDILETKQSELFFSLRTKSGNSLALLAHLGLISTGVFKNNILILLYPRSPY